MKGISSWSFNRYRPAVHGDDLIYINRVVPHETSISLFWENSEKCNVYFRKKGSDERWIEYGCTINECVIAELDTGNDYEFFVENSSGQKSATGYARTGCVPGEVVNYLHPDDKKYSFSGNYLGTPCLLCHPDGYYLASMDLFADAAPQNLTLIFRSDDKGRSWYHYSELFPCEWGTLFTHRGDVYMLSTSTEYGDMLIGKSLDGGKTWGTPTVIQRGAGRQNVPGWHKSSGKVVEYKGRLWCSYDFGAHKAGGHASTLISISIDDDLMRAENWTITDPLKYDPLWNGACLGDTRGFIEGTPVIGRDGILYNFLRYSMNRGNPNYGYAGMLKADTSEPEKALDFAKFTPFLGNHSKFDIVWDDKSEKYYSIVSRIRNADCAGDRNLLSFISSTDLEHWEVIEDIIDYTDKDPMLHGFQYVSLCIENDDIIFLCRTATNGARSFHDNNYVTFHRIEQFRIK